VIIKATRSFGPGSPRCETGAGDGGQTRRAWPARPDPL
jgi:hypothetical protein